MRTAHKRNAAPPGGRHGAFEKRQTPSVYSNTGDTSTGATVETPAAKDRRPWLGRDRTEWLRQVSMHEATKFSSLRAALQLALWADAHGRLCRTQDELGEATGMDARVIRRAMKELADAGHITVRRGGGAGHASLIQLVTWDAGTGQSEHPNRTRLSSFGRAPNRTNQVAKPDKTSMETGQSGSQTGQNASNQAENANEINGPEKRLIAYRESIGRALKGPIPTSEDCIEHCTSDARACAPGGATAAQESIDTEEPPDDDVPPEVRAQWYAEDYERFGHEQFDGDEGEPDPDIEPDQHAAKDSSEGHAKAAHRPPVEDDDHVDFALADHADEEHDPPPIAVSEAERRVLRGIVGSEFQDGTDTTRCWVWAYSANPDGETDPFDQTGNFARVLACVVRKGLAAVRHNEGTDDEVRITAAGMVLIQEHHARGRVTAATVTR